MYSCVHCNTVLHLTGERDEHISRELHARADALSQHGEGLFISCRDRRDVGFGFDCLVGGMSMHIELTQSMTQWLSETLTEISTAELPTHVHNCPHCSNPVRYPTVARQQDIEDFTLIMRSASDVMKRHGITANLLADIRAECHIQIAKNKAKATGGAA